MVVYKMITNDVQKRALWNLSIPTVLFHLFL